MSPNMELLRETRAYIEAHPDEWNQATWHCGTSYCFAGHAAKIAHGGELLFANWFGLPMPNDKEYWLTSGVTIASFARHALGLSSDGARALFNGHNTLADIDAALAIIETVHDDASELLADMKLLELTHAVDAREMKKMPGIFVPHTMPGGLRQALADYVSPEFMWNHYVERIPVLRELGGPVETELVRASEPEVRSAVETAVAFVREKQEHADAVAEAFEGSRELVLA